MNGANGIHKVVKTGKCRVEFEFDSLPFGARSPTPKVSFSSPLLILVKLNNYLVKWIILWSLKRAQNANKELSDFYSRNFIMFWTSLHLSCPCSFFFISVENFHDSSRWLGHRSLLDFIFIFYVFSLTRSSVPVVFAVVEFVYLRFRIARTRRSLSSSVAIFPS